MIPVFVPSYKRPNAAFLRRSLLYSFPMYVFIRKEEKQSYNWLKNRPYTKLVALKSVRNIGETRAVMVQYAKEKRIDKIFMIDDDVTRLDLSIYDEKRKMVRASGTIKGHPEDWSLVLSEWERLWKEEALFGASYRPFSWSMKEKDLMSNKRAQLQQAVGVNVKRLNSCGLNYQSNFLVGNEDLFLQLECYQNGLECVRTPKIQYDCPSMGIGKGGCNNSEPGSIQYKQEKRVAAFISACTNPSLIKVSKTRSGIKSIKFVWQKINALMTDTENTKCE